LHTPHGQSRQPHNRTTAIRVNSPSCGAIAYCPLPPPEDALASALTPHTEVVARAPSGPSQLDAPLDSVALPRAPRCLRPPTPHRHPAALSSEASSGSTGVALAAVGAAVGQPVTVVLPDAVSRERMALIHTHGGPPTGGGLGSPIHHRAPAVISLGAGKGGV